MMMANHLSLTEPFLWIKIEGFLMRKNEKERKKRYTEREREKHLNFLFCFSSFPSSFFI